MRVLLGLVFFIIACSDNQQSGVMTETNTGKKVSTRILVVEKDVGTGTIQEIVQGPYFIVSSDFIKGRDTLVSTGFTDAKGEIEFEHNGLKNLHVVVYDSLFFQGSFFEIVSDSSTAENDFLELTVGGLSQVFLHPKTEEWEVGDEICIAGSLICKEADEFSITNDFLLFDRIPQGDYRELVHIQKENYLPIVIDWSFDKTEILNQNQSELQLPQYEVSLPLQGLSPAESLRNMPFPIALPNEINSPCLMDAEGRTVLLEKDFAEEGQTLYWGQMQEAIMDSSVVDSLFIRFQVFASCMDNQSVEMNQGEYSDHFEGNQSGFFGSSISLSPSTSFVNLSTPALMTEGKMGVGFWIQMDSLNQVEDYARIFEIRDLEGSGFLLQQRGGTGDVNLRIDTKTGDYNALFGRAKILDGSWHHYAFNVAGNLLTVFVDGVLIEKVAFNIGDGFVVFQSPRLGGIPMMTGNLDELLIVNGEQGESWWKLYYSLQLKAREWLVNPLSTED